MLDVITELIAVLVEPLFVALYTLFSVLFALPGLGLVDIINLIF